MEMLVVVGVACSDDLIDAGKILEILEILGDTAGPCIENGLFDAVCPCRVASGHQEISNAPCVV